MAKKSYSFGRLLMQIALGAMLAIAGIWALMGGGDFGAKAIGGLLNGTVGKICVIIFGVIELLAGIFLILELFMGDIFGKIDNILMLIIIIVWIIAIVLADFIGGLFKGGFSLEWLWSLASHVLVLGVMFNLKD